MKMGKKGLKLVKSFEGLYLKAYKCPAGVWTIGYGHTGKVNGKAIRSGMKITEKTADQLLRKDMEEFEKSQATLKLMSELAKGEASAIEKGYVDISEVEALLGVSNG